MENACVKYEMAVLVSSNSKSLKNKNLPGRILKQSQNTSEHIAWSDSHFLC